MLLQPGSMCWLGVVCSSFVWINSSTHMRSPWDPTGDTNKPYVANGNCLVSVASVFAMLAWLRGSIFVIENPKGSQLVNSIPMQWLIRFFNETLSARTGLSSLYQFTVNLGDWGSETLKPVWLYSPTDLTAPLTSFMPFHDRPSNSCSSQPVTLVLLGRNAC